MGIPIRKLSLLALTAVGGGALLMDKTLLSDAAGAASSLTGLVDQVQAAQDIAQTLDSGDPAAIQGLLETLVEQEGTDPGNVQAGLFGLGEGFNFPGLGSGDDKPSEADTLAQGDRVSMIIATAGGGLAVINGKPMRAGQSIDDLTLIEVHPDRVLIEDDEGRRALSLR
ncbi:MAG: hypothetical protein K8E66_09620 [Phycisphaerales bacterium]|nr:hypothetical protein [Phycisphaerales bacterium]